MFVCYIKKYQKIVFRWYKKSWLIAFPLVGAIFDVVLMFIPFVPTVMNILGLVFGMITPKKEG